MTDTAHARSAASVIQEQEVLEDDLLAPVGGVGLLIGYARVLLELRQSAQPNLGAQALP